EEGNDLDPAERLGELQGSHAVIGHSVDFCAALKQDLDGGSASCQCLVMQEGPTSVVFRLEHGRVLDQLFPERRSHCLAHRMLLNLYLAVAKPTFLLGNDTD